MKRRVAPSLVRLGRTIQARIFGADAADEVDEEFAFHVEMRIRQLVSEGMTLKEAQDVAMQRFRDIDEVKAVCRRLAEQRERKMTWMTRFNELGQDLRFAVRQLRRSPGLALAAVVTLGLGIGANTAVFSVVNGVLLSPLPFPEPGRLVEVRTRYLPPSGFDIDRFPISIPELFDYRQATASFEVLGAYELGTRTLVGADADPTRVHTVFLDRSALEALGVRPQLGRWFTQEEDRPGVLVGLIGHDLWTTRFGADPSIVGSTVTVGDGQFLVTGVMPPGFVFPTARYQLFENYGIDTSDLGSRSSHGTYGIGRLLAGVTLEQAVAESRGIHAGWAEVYPHNRAHFPIFERLSDNLVGTDVRRALLVLMAAVAVVLLIAVVNVANLLMARGEGRLREVTVRRSLGAERGRIVRQLLTESLVLAVVGGLVGIALGELALDALLAINPEALPRAELIHLDGTVLLFTATLTTATVIAFGLLPALKLSGASASAVGSAPRSTGSRKERRIRNTLVGAEVGMSLVVVVAAGLLGRSFQKLTNVDAGVAIEGRLVFEIETTGARYRDHEAVAGYFEELQARLEALPGVSSVSAVSHLPLGGSESRVDFVIEGRPRPTGDEPMWSAQWTAVLPKYFETMGIEVTQGRPLGAGDAAGAESVVVVSEDVVEQYFEGRSPVGELVGLHQEEMKWARIVGVVPRTRTNTLDSEVIPQIYFSFAQGPDTDLWTPREMAFTIRTAVPPETLVGAARRTVRELDPRLAFTSLGTMREIFDRSVARPKMLANLLGSFALIALLLAAVGTYGVVSYSVSKRTREMGIRIALGAQRATVARLVISEGAVPALAGILLAVPVALASSRLLGDLLYEVSPRDPTVFAGLSLLLLGLALVSSWLPARRATRLAPTEALRYE